MTPQQSESGRHEGEPATTNRRSEWFYIQRGETFGPVSSADLCAAAHLGFLRPDDLVRRSDKADWVVARLVHGLFKQVG